MLRRRPATRTVLCDCTCPYWGKPHDEVYRCRCTCGTEADVCGYCLQAGRRTACQACSILSGPEGHPEATNSDTS